MLACIYTGACLVPPPQKKKSEKNLHCGIPIFLMHKDMFLLTFGALKFLYVSP